MTTKWVPRKLGGRTLLGRSIVLEPLSDRHHDEIRAIARERGLFTYTPVDGRRPGKGILRFYTSGEPKTVFAIRRKSDGKLVGSIFYFAINAGDARLEIGTWLIREAQGTGINDEAKYLMLRNAFSAGYNRIEFKTDGANERSRGAMLKLGAHQEGTLRRRSRKPNGRFRDEVYFSILKTEWPDVRKALKKRIAEKVGR